MKVDRLTLTNFRGLVNSTLDFTPGFNLIVGINGAGKTTVLNALRLCLAKALPELVTPGLSFPGVGMVKEDITIGRDAANLTCHLECYGQTHSLTLVEQREGVRDALDPDGGVIDPKDLPAVKMARRGRRHPAGDPRLEGTLRGQTSQRSITSSQLSPVPDLSQRTSGELPLVLHLSVRRALVRQAVPRGVSRHPGYQQIFAEDRGLALQRLTDWWRGKEALASEHKGDSLPARQLEAVRRAVGILLPHLSDWRIEDGELKVTKSAQVSRMNDEGNTVLETIDRRLPLRMMSDGERSLSAIATDIAQRLVTLNETVADPLATGSGVVLIDELDLHLHPQWQRTVVEGLRAAFPRVQFICTTHSLFLIQSQRTGNLVRLDNEGDEERPAENFHAMSIEDIAEEVQHVQIPQRSQRYLDMIAAAERYYTLLRDSNDPYVDMNALKRELDELAMPFSDDPAFQALLKQQRILALGNEG